MMSIIPDHSFLAHNILGLSGCKAGKMGCLKDLCYRPLQGYNATVSSTLINITRYAKPSKPKCQVRQKWIKL